MKWISILRYFYLIGAVNALFFSILIFSKPVRKLADKLLAWWLIVLSLQLLLPFIYLGDLQNFSAIAGAEITFYVVHPLLLYLYTKAMTGQFPTRRRLFFPVGFAIVVELTVFLFLKMPAQERVDLIFGKNPFRLVFFLTCIPMTFYFIYFFLISFGTLKNYKSNILHVYSYKENVDLMWLRKLVLFYYILLLLAVPLAVVFYFNDISMAEGDYFYFAGLTIFIFFLGYWGYKQGEIFNFQTEESNNKQINHHDFSKRSAAEEYQSEIKILSEIMEKEKPYLEPTLSIFELAKLTGMQPHQLSRLINKSFSCNFFEYINGFRVESFKENLVSPKYKDYTLLGIAFECGFNSKSAFNRVFKDQTGLTPGEYKKLHHQEVLIN